MSLRELYQEMIIDHSKHPRHFGMLAHATHIKVGHNPLCGDRLVLFIDEKNNVVVDAAFEGAGCAISVASASMMLEAIRGKSITEVTTLFNQFHALVTEGKESDSDMGKLAVFSGVTQYPVRVKCATLAWHTLMAALTDDNKEVSTE